MVLEDKKLYVTASLTLIEKLALNRAPRKNKTSSAVQLKHLPTGTVIKSQATRSRSQNRKIARQLLAEKIELAEKGHESRRARKAAVKQKKKASKSKKARRKYRNLQEAVNDDRFLASIGEHGDTHDRSRKEYT